MSQPTRCTYIGAGEGLPPLRTLLGDPARRPYRGGGRVAAQPVALRTYAVTGERRTVSPGPPRVALFLDWALESERERTKKKVAATMDAARAFYSAMRPRIDEILDYLEDYFGGDAPAHARRLYLMSLSLVEVTTLVELYKRPGAVDACDPLRFVRRG